MYICYSEEGGLSVGLTFVCGRAGSGKSRFCIDLIRDSLEAQPDGEPLVLLLPEQATFQTERELAAATRNKGFVRASVVGFRRLAHKVLSETGGACRPQITDLGKKLIVSRMLSAYQDELKLFTGTANRRSFAETICGLIQEFKNYNITPAQVRSAVTPCGSTALANKLADLSLLYQGFESYLESNYLDTEDYLKLLTEKIPNSQFLRGAKVWIDGFHWFTPAEYSVLEQIIRAADQVYVTLCLSGPDTETHRKETTLFHRQYKTRLHLKGLASRWGIDTDDILLEQGPRFLASPVLDHVEKVYAGIVEPGLQTLDNSGLQIAEAANHRAEVEGIARDIIRLCRDKGYRWRDSAVLLRDPETYGPIIERVFEDYGIPFFSDRKRLAVHHPLAELLRSVLEIFQENWSYEPIFRCLKTDLFPMSMDAVEKLENYTLEFGIRGSRWTNGVPWTFQRRLSLNEDQDITEREQNRLDEINAIRFKVTLPLLSVSRQIADRSTAAGITEALYNLLVELHAADTLDTWAQQAETEGDLEVAKEHRQVWTGVVELFDQIIETCGEQIIDLDEYAQVLNDGLEGIKLSLIPPGLDHVTVSSLDQTRVGNVRAVYVPGANDGVFPMKGKGEGVLTDSERNELRKLGLELAPGARDDVFAEKFLVYTALTRASEYLWLSYPLADGEGKALMPSPEAGKLRSIAAIEKIKTLSFEPQDGMEREYLAQAQRGLSALAVSLRRYKNGESIGEDWWAVYNWALTKADLKEYLASATAGLFHNNWVKPLPPILAGRLYSKQNRLRGSVTRFENYQACPFKHFAQYGLSLQERAVFRLQAPDLGQFLHAVLKEFGDLMAVQGRNWGSLSGEECRQICGQIVTQLAPKLQNEILLSTEQYKHMLGRLTRRVERAVGRLTEFDRVSSFKPAALELSFGGADAKSLPPLVYPLADGSRLEITGQIDRLDIAEHMGRQYLLVVDYKSGKVNLSLPDVYYGLKLQLLTYLLAACRLWPHLDPQTAAEPAGVLYYFLKNPAVSGEFAKSEQEVCREINRQLKMPGWLLKEPAIIELIDGTVTGWSEFTKVGLGKSQEFYNACLPQLKTREEFSGLLDHVERIFAGTAENILSGDITIRPYLLDRRTPCGYCPYQAVCQFDPLIPGSEYRNLAKLGETEIIKKLGQGKEE